MRDVAKQNLIYNEMREFLQKPDQVFSEALQTIVDYGYVLDAEKYEEVVALVRANVSGILHNILECEDMPKVLSAVWLLENYFDMSYEELYGSIVDDVKHFEVFRSSYYPAKWLGNYYLVKAGYDYFYSHKEMLLNFYPKAETEITETFPRSRRKVE